MITAWRIVQIEQKNNAFTGEGASIYGGRWNNKGVAVVYTSSTISLASMEILVNLPSTSLLENYFRIAVEFEGYLVEELKELPKKWNSRPASPVTKNIGDQWVRENRSVILKVPSVVVPAEDNYLLNPNHPDWFRIKTKDPIVYHFDPRFVKKK